MTGNVLQINVSDGGVPKRFVQSAEVTEDGLVGDRQDNLKFHGPDRAISLYAYELIEQLWAEGHPVQPGYLGENVTTAGLDWSLMEPGLEMTIGKVVLELTSPANPCNQIGDFFSDGAFSRISETKWPGWSRWYARVVVPGKVVTGDPIVF